MVSRTLLHGMKVKWSKQTSTTHSSVFYTTNLKWTTVMLPFNSHLMHAQWVILRFTVHFMDRHPKWRVRSTCCLSSMPRHRHNVVTNIPPVSICIASRRPALCILMAERTSRGCKLNTHGPRQTGTCLLPAFWRMPQSPAYSAIPNLSYVEPIFRLAKSI